MFSPIAALLAVGLTSLTSVTAYVYPVGDTPFGNPIMNPSNYGLPSGQNLQIPVSEPYRVSWNPTTSGKVSILLLRGPPSNLQRLYPIAEGLPNNGEYSWTPSNSLEPDTQGYALQIVCESNGQYQYSTPFGIQNTNPAPSSIPPGVGSTCLTPWTTATTTSTTSSSTWTSTWSSSWYYNESCGCTETWSMPPIITGLPGPVPEPGLPGPAPVNPSLTVGPFPPVNYTSTTEFPGFPENTGFPAAQTAGPTPYMAAGSYLKADMGAAIAGAVGAIGALILAL